LLLRLYETGRQVLEKALRFQPQEALVKQLFRLYVLVLSLSAAISSASAQGSGSLDADLHQQFKITRLAPSPTGIAVTDQGVILVVKKAGLRAYPPTTLVLATNKVQDGNIDTPKDNPFLGPSLLLPPDTRVYVMRLTTDPKKDRVIFIIMQCDPCNSAQQPSYFKAQVAFQFPQGYLSGGADAGQVADVVAQVLAPDNAGGDQNAQQPQQQNAAPAPAQGQQAPVTSQDAVPQQTQTITKGQTEDQVIAAFGQPDKIVDLGAKKLYVYKDMKITFIGGKVVDVQ
jgi:hypothetical protein